MSSTNLLAQSTELSNENGTGQQIDQNNAVNGNLKCEYIYVSYNIR